MVASMLFFSVMNNCVREASLESHSTVIALFRNLFTLIVMATWVMWRSGMRGLSTEHPGRHVIRALFGLTSMELWFYALSEMPINQATALSFTTPIFVSLFAILFLKESSSLPRWGAIAIGFAGMLVILRPESSEFSLIGYLVLLGAAIRAAGSVLIKTIAKIDQPETIVFWQALLMTPMALPFALPYWQVPSAWGLFWILTVAVSSTAAHLCLIRAFQRSEMTVLMPFDFTRLIFTAAIAYFWFHEVLDSWTLIGGLLIIFGSVWGAMEGNMHVRRHLKRALGFWRNV